MRDILFKAKRVDNGAWVTGRTIVQFKDKGVLSAFMPSEYGNCECEYDSDTEDVLSFYGSLFYKVEPETVCQYTGMTDKNGVKIFDGDKLCVSKGEPYEEIGKARYVNGCFIIEYSDSWDFLDDVKCVSEIVGNIHDKE